MNPVTYCSTNRYIDTCSSTAGTIQSPNHPSHYDIFTDITFPLEVDPAATIKLTFTAFDIGADCRYDYVKVLDTYGSQLAKLCGDTLPAPLTSSGNTMTVIFHSDCCNARTGFSASWETMPGTNITNPAYKVQDTAKHVSNLYVEPKHIICLGDSLP